MFKNNAYTEAGNQFTVVEYVGFHRMALALAVLILRVPFHPNEKQT
jgi:hypothetical protein